MSDHSENQLNAQSPEAPAAALNEIKLTEENLARSSTLLAFVLLTCALFSLAITAILIKISLNEISVNATLFNRLWIGTIIFGLWNGLNRVRTETSDDRLKLQQSYQIGAIALLLALGIIHVLGRLSYTWSLTQTSAANATILSCLRPVLTTFGGWLLFQQRFEQRFLIGLVLATIGSIFLGLEDFQQSTNSLLGDSAALVSAIFYTGNLLLVEQIRDKFPVITILMWRCAIGTVFMLPIVFFFEEQIFPISLSGWLAVIALAVVCEALGHGLVVYSLKYFSSAFIAVFLLLDPVVVAILAWIIFSENLSIFNIFDFALILGGAYLAISSKEAMPD